MGLERRAAVGPCGGWKSVAAGVLLLLLLLLLLLHAVPDQGNEL